MKNYIEESTIKKNTLVLQKAYGFDAVILSASDDSDSFQFSSCPEKYPQKLLKNFSGYFKQGLKKLLFCTNSYINIENQQKNAIVVSFRLHDNLFEAGFFYSNKNFLDTFNRENFLTDYYMSCFFYVFKTIGFKKILSSSQNILMIKDSNFKYIYANDKCLDFFGIPLEDILGKDDFQIASKEEAQQIRKTDKVALKNEDVYNCRREIHNKIYSVDKCKINLQDDIEGIWVVARDISDEENAKSELFKSKQQYQNLFYNMLSGFALHKIVKNKKGIPIDYQFVEINDGFEKQTGLKRADILGKNVTEVLPTIKKDSFDWIEFYGKVALDGREMRIEQFSEHLQKWYSVYAFSPEYDYFATIIEDITSKKMIDIETIANQTRLESLVKILQYQSDDTDTVLKHALNESVKLTNSEIGYVFTYSNDKKELEVRTWFDGVSKKCNVSNPFTVHPLEKTGLWGDVIRFGKSIIDNDFKAPSDRKKGLPYGHPKLSKFLSVPLFSDEKVIAVVGVANKKIDYTKMDELQLRLLMSSVWALIERKQARQKTKKEEIIKQNFAESLESSPLGMMYWKYKDGKSEIIKWNESAEKIFGWKSSEAIGSDFLEVLYSPADVESAHKRISKLKSLKLSYHFKNRCYTKSGKILDIKWFITYIKSEQNNQVYGMSLAENYTEINKYQKDLEFTKNQFEYALEGSQSGVWDLNIITNEVHVNDKWWKVYGYEKGENPEIDNYSMMDFWRSAIYPDDKKKAIEKVQNLIDGKSPFINSEYRIKFKDGSWIWILDRGFPSEYDNNGKPIRMTGTIQNISDRMAIQKDMEVRNFLAGAFIENPGKTLYKEILKYILNVTNSPIGFFSCLNELNEFSIEAFEGIFEKDKNTTELDLSDKQMKLNWSKLVLQKSSIIRNSSFRISRSFISFNRMVIVPIEYGKKIIGRFLVANSGNDYTNQDKNNLEIIADRISHLLYARLQSIQSENKRKKTESELYKSQRKLSLALEASRIGSWDWDIDQDVVTFDRQFARILGYSNQELVEKKFKSWSNFTHPDDVQIGLDSFKKLSLNNVSALEIEQRYRHKTKGWIWISKRGKFTKFNKDGKPSRMNGTIVNITKRKIAELENQHQKNELKWLSEKQAELVKSKTPEDLYEFVTKTLSEKIPASIVLFVVKSKDGNYFLPKFLKISKDNPSVMHDSALFRNIMQYKFSIPKVDCIAPNRSIHEVFVEDLYKSISFVQKKAFELVVKYFDVKRHYLVSLIGKKVHLANVYILLRDKNDLQDKETIESFVFRASLIFERILIENEEKETKKRLEQVAEQAKSIIWETDASGKITYISPYVKKLLGYEPSELIHSKKWFNIHSEDEKEIFKAIFEDSIHKKEPFHDLFTELLTIKGEVLYVSSSGVPIISGGEVIGFRGSDYDITTLKNIDKAKNEFINTVSHEMRTPLTVIKEASGILGMGELSQQQQEVLNISNNNINRLSRIINDVLDFQKLQARKVELVYERIDLKELLEEIVSAHKPIAEKKGLVLSTSFYTGNTRLLTDSDKLYEVMGNLINNAIKYTDNGSIKIVVKDKIFTNNIIIQVIDTGMGIPKKELPKLFKAFSQTSGVNNRKTGSTGLGLVICREIVELFGGTITVDSTVGVGTTFSVDLPQKKSLARNKNSL